MRLFRSVIEPGSRWLARHFQRLRRTLEALYDRLREAIAVAVARAAEDAVREGVHALLADTPPLSPPDYPRRNYTPAGAWRDPNDPDEELRRWEENLDNDYATAARGEAGSRVQSDEPAPEPTRLRRALAEGLQAASWWLRRDGRFPVLTALSAGLVVVLASYTGGRWPAPAWPWPARLWACCPSPTPSTPAPGHWLPSVAPDQ
jgi:hypothetical protein